MYIKSTRRWIEGGRNTGHTQHTGRQWFLILVQPGYMVEGLSGYKHYISSAADMDNKPRALVRKVALSQFGPWMMGTARAFGERITCTGDYGNSGLVCTVSRELYEKAIELPEEIYQAWAQDTTGWNDAGASGPILRAWAIGAFDKLAPKGATY